MKFLFFITATIFCFQHSALASQGSFENWLNQLRPNDSTSESINLFFQKNFQADSNSDYAVNLLETFKQDLAKNISAQQKNSCSAQMQLQFNDSLTQSKNSEEKEFESELLRISTTDCLPSLDLKKVVGTFLDDTFQKKYISGLVDSHSNSTKTSVCQKTSVFPLGKSEYCYQNNIWKSDDTVVIISLTTSTNPKSSAPVYFRTVGTAFTKLADGTIAMSTLTYGRGPDLPFHGMVKSIATQQHKNYLEGLIETASSY